MTVVKFGNVERRIRRYNANGNDKERHEVVDYENRLEPYCAMH